jgi:hypothetical protein
MLQYCVALVFFQSVDEFRLLVVAESFPPASTVAGLVGT